MLPTFSYFNKVLCIRGLWVGYFSIYKLLTLHAIIAIALKTRNAYSSKLLKKIKTLFLLENKKKSSKYIRKLTIVTCITGRQRAV